MHFRYGQQLYVSPKHGIVIAKNAAFDQYYYPLLQDYNHEELALHALAAIAEAFKDA